MAEVKSLRALLFNGHYDLAAHRLVYGLVKASTKRNGNRKKRKQRKSK